jgi:hypothetical protein
MTQRNEQRIVDAYTNTEGYDPFEVMRAEGGTDTLKGRLAAEIEMTTGRIASAEQGLQEHARQLRDLADKIDSNVTAKKGDRIYTLNPLGEMQSAGARIDALIAERATRIEQLQALMRLAQL